MKKTLYFAIFLLFFQYSKGQQLQVADASIPPFTPENLITNYFLGDGVKVQSITYEGSKKAIGLFDKGQATVGIKRGIAMTTGRVDNDVTNLNIKGITNPASQTASNDNNLTTTDPDIAKLVKPGQNIRDMSKYTITFIPTSDTLRFRYVFASEEYPEFGCSPFNDVFGFFISGPGINGTFQNNGINIALVPGTDLPVSIDNIHPQNPNNSNCKPFNAQYYVPNNGIKQPVYDGFTKVFTAEAIVIPCQTYTIKLIIADASDGALDSGVFLEEKSFGTGTLQVKPSSISLDGTVSEGCTAGKVTFSLPKKVEKDFPIDVQIIGTAQNGIDFKQIPTKLAIPAGDSAIIIPIDPFEDNIPEGVESIGFDVKIDICERDTFWIYIRENTIKKPNLGKDITICKGESVKLDGTLPVPLPPPSIFTNTDSIVINTVTPFNPNVPATISTINVFGVQPLQLQPNMIESVCFNMRHQWIDDIDCYLVAPNGQFIALSTDNGGSGGNGAGIDFYKNTCFSPDVSKSITTGVVPFSDIYLPEDNWADLWSVKDNPVNGKWSLQIIDDQTGAQGKLLDWKITFKPYYQIKYNWTSDEGVGGLSCNNCPSPTATPDKTTTYILEANDNYGCPVSDTITIFVQDSLDAPKVICNIVTHNTIQFAWQPILFANGYEISIDGGPWIAPDFVTSHKIENLGLLETKNIKVRAKGTCGAKIGNGSCTTLNCQAPTPKIDVSKNISCFGKNDGLIQVSATGGLPPYNFTLNSGQTNNTGIFNNLKPGQYSLSVTESATCTAILKIQIDEPAPLKFKFAADSVTCFGGDDAAAAITMTGGTTPYTYQWSNGETKDLVFDLKKFNYTVTVSDVNGCSIIDTVKVFEPPKITFTTEINDVKCFSDENGAARIIPANGKSPYTYTWNTNQGLQIAQKAINLSAGEHFVTVTDHNGCTIKTSVIIKAASQITVKKSFQNILCFGEKTGKASVSLTGGTPPYKYQWSDATKSKDTLIANLGIGKYFLTITDKEGCEQKDSVTITQPTALKTTLTTVPTTCDNNTDGKASVVVSGGSIPYFYAWSNGQNNVPNANNLAPQKEYYVTVQDVSKCTVVDTFKVGSPATLTADKLIKSLKCANDTNGEASVTVAGGTPPYTYKWSNNESTNAITNLKEGDYYVTVTDKNYCQIIIVCPIAAPGAVVVSNEIIDDVKCFGAKTGKIDIDVSGGVPPYTFEWSNKATTKNLKDLAAGTYELIISDNSSCKKIVSYEIKQPNAPLDIKFNVSDTLCFGKKGEIIASVTGGTIPYEYQWQTGEIKNILADTDPGNYFLTVTDINKCVLKDTAILYSIGEVNIALSQKGASCNLSTDGEAAIENIFYGNKKTNLSQFVYSWNDSKASTTPSIDNLTGGQTYTVVATDKRGCSGTASIKIDNETGLSIVAKSKTTPKCFGEANGTITVEGIGGVKPYSFLWDDNAKNQVESTAKDLLSGSYEVTLSDSNGCKGKAKFDLENPEKLKINLKIKNLDCPQDNTGATSVEGIGGVKPYNFVWSNKSQNNLISNLAAGTYKVTMTDANGCTINTTAKINQPTPLILDINGKDATCAGSKNGSFTANVIGGTPPFTFSVNGSNFNTKNIFSGLKPNLYDIVVKDKNGCLFNEQINIGEPFPIAIDLGKDTVVTYGDSILLQPIVKDAFGKLTYQWTPFAPDLLSCEKCEKPFASPTSTTFFTLQVKDENQCIGNATIKIEVESKFIFLVPTGFSPNDDGKNDNLIAHGESTTKILYFTVYDKWGEKLFEQANMPINDEKAGWNGIFRNSKMPPGVYTWYAKIQFQTGDIKTVSGVTTLLRE